MQEILLIRLAKEQKQDNVRAALDRILGVPTENLTLRQLAEAYQIADLMEKAIDVKKKEARKIFLDSIGPAVEANDIMAQGKEEEIQAKADAIIKQTPLAGDLLQISDKCGKTEKSKWVIVDGAKLSHTVRAGKKTLNATRLELLLKEKDIPLEEAGDHVFVPNEDKLAGLIAMKKLTAKEVQGCIDEEEGSDVFTVKKAPWVEALKKEIAAYAAETQEDATS